MVELVVQLCPGGLCGTYGTFDPEIESWMELDLDHDDVIEDGEIFYPKSLDVPNAALIVVKYDLSNKPVGRWALYFKNPDGAYAGWPFDILPLPQITGMEPASAGDGDILDLKALGVYFDNARIRLQRSGVGTVRGTNPVTSPTLDGTTATFDLRGVDLGYWDLDVTNESNFRGQLHDAFEILPGPNILSVAPLNAPDTGPATITLTGRRFEAGADVRLRLAGHSDLVASSVTVAPGGLSLQAQFNLTGASVGKYDILATNPAPGELRAVNPAGFEVQRAPVMADYQPQVAEDGALVDIAVQGEGFLTGATAKLKLSGQPDILASSVQVAVGGTSLVARFDLRDRPVGAWTFTVSNPNGLTTVPGSFQVRSGPRALDADPGTGEQGSSVQLTIQGGPFTSTATMSIERGATVRAATGVVVAPGGASVTGTLSLLDTDTGAWDVVVHNNDGRAAWIGSGFTVQRLLIESNTPTSAGDGGPVVVLINGARFRAGGSASLLRSGTQIVGTDLGSNPQGTMLAATFDLSGATNGSWDLVVRNTQGSADTLEGAVTIVPGPPIASFGLEQAWNDCAGETGAATDITTLCEPDGEGTLLATFRAPHNFEGFVAMDVVMDVATADGTLPPYWRFVEGECHESGIDIGKAAPPGMCSGIASPWGVNGSSADAFITAYAPGYNNRPDRARLLISVVRSSSDPITLVAGQRYYGFHLNLLSPETACAGCASAVDWHWVSATFYSVSNPEPMVIRNPGLRTKTVTVNGGITGPTIASIDPERVKAEAAVDLTIYGNEFWPGAQVHLAHEAGNIVYGQVLENATGQMIRARFDLTGRPGGHYDVYVTNPGKARGQLVQGLQVDGITPTLVLAFDAEPVESGVQIRWRLASPGDWNRSWIERATSDVGPWHVVAGELHSSGDEMWVVDEGSSEGARWYRLIGERAGTQLTLGTIQLEGTVVPTVTRLEGVVPNPSSGSLRVAFSLDRAQPVRITVHDIQGRELAVVADGVLPAGNHAARWNGATPNGQVRPGLYFLRAQLGAQIEKRRIAIVR